LIPRTIGRSFSEFHHPLLSQSRRYGRSQPRPGPLPISFFPVGRGWIFRDDGLGEFPIIITFFFYFSKEFFGMANQITQKKQLIFSLGWVKKTEK
jgi:hypothetical protein